MIIRHDRLPVPSIFGGFGDLSRYSLTKLDLIILCIFIRPLVLLVYFVSYYNNFIPLLYTNLYSSLGFFFYLSTVYTIIIC
jgi:hypothetical protein